MLKESEFLCMQSGVAIDAIKQFWPSLRTWIGDPCLFRPYDWTSCSVDTKPRVTELYVFLSNHIKSFMSVCTSSV